MCWEEGTTLKCLGTSDLNPTTRIEKKITQNNLKGKTTGAWCEQTRNQWRRTSITYTCRSIRKWTFRNHSEVISFDFFSFLPFFFFTLPRTADQKRQPNQESEENKEGSLRRRINLKKQPSTISFHAPICYPPKYALFLEEFKKHPVGTVWIMKHVRSISVPSFESLCLSNCCSQDWKSSREGNFLVQQIFLVVVVPTVFFLFFFEHQPQLRPWARIHFGFASRCMSLLSVQCPFRWNVFFFLFPFFFSNLKYNIALFFRPLFLFHHCRNVGFLAFSGEFLFAGSFACRRFLNFFSLALSFGWWFSSSCLQNPLCDFLFFDQLLLTPSISSSIVSISSHFDFPFFLEFLSDDCVQRRRQFFWLDLSCLGAFPSGAALLSLDFLSLEVCCFLPIPSSHFPELWRLGFSCWRCFLLFFTFPFVYWCLLAVSVDGNLLTFSFLLLSDLDDSFTAAAFSWKFTFFRFFGTFALYPAKTWRHCCSLCRILSDPFAVTDSSSFFFLLLERFLCLFQFFFEWDCLQCCLNQVLHGLLGWSPFLLSILSMKCCFLGLTTFNRKDWMDSIFDGLRLGWIWRIWSRMLKEPSTLLFWWGAAKMQVWTTHSASAVFDSLKNFTAFALVDWRRSKRARIVSFHIHHCPEVLKALSSLWSGEFCSHNFDQAKELKVSLLPQELHGRFEAKEEEGVESADLCFFKHFQKECCSYCSKVYSICYCSKEEWCLKPPFGVVFVSLNSCFEEVLKVLLKHFFLLREEKRQEEDHGGEERRKTWSSFIRLSDWKAIQKDLKPGGKS